MPEPKKDCFGYRMGKCKVLAELVCEKRNCSFYKTKEQFEREREEAERRLRR